MTRRLSLITAVGVAALSVSVPTAFGKVHANAEVAPVLAQPNPMIEDGFAQAVAKKLSLTGMRDAHDRGIVTNQGVGSGLSTYTPFDQARPATLAWSPEVARQVAIARQELTDRYVDSHQRSAPGVGSTEVLTINSSRDIEWPQIGVGFGIGLLLALGLGLTMRAVHSRPFAH